MNEEEKEEEIVLQFLKKNKNTGLSITELVQISQLSRSSTRTILARLEGAGKIKLRKVGMAKVYSLKEDFKEEFREKEKAALEQAQAIST